MAHSGAPRGLQVEAKGLPAEVNVTCNDLNIRRVTLVRDAANSSNANGVSQCISNEVESPQSSFERNTFGVDHGLDHLTRVSAHGTP